MKVSVIVTTYNSLEYLKKVLDGLSVQVHPPDEIIVADDGSGPETGEYVRGFASTVSFEVKHVWHEDKGFRAAKIRNEAVKEAMAGGYLIFLDGDCMVNRHFVSDHLSLAERGCFVQGKRVLVNRVASAGVTSAEINSPAALLGLALRGMVSNLHHIIRLPFFPAHKKVSHRGIKTCNMGVLREDVYAVNGFNEQFVGWGREDSEFAARLYRHGLVRKDHPFMAICFHLWHAENKRDNLHLNDMLLDEALRDGKLRCDDGIEKPANS